MKWQFYGFMHLSGVGLGIHAFKSPEKVWDIGFTFLVWSAGIRQVRQLDQKDFDGVIDTIMKGWD